MDDNSTKVIISLVALAALLGLAGMYLISRKNTVQTKTLQPAIATAEPYLAPSTTYIS